MSRPRITISLSPESYAVLRRLTALTGESMSSTIGGLTDAIAPTLSRSADLFEQAQRASSEVKANLQSAATTADQAMRPHLQEAVRAYQEAMASLESVVSDGNDPRPSNHGGHTPTPPPTFPSGRGH